MATIKTIILSRFKKTNLNESWIQERSKLCEKCNHNSLNTKRTTVKSKAYKVLSDLLTWLTRAKKEEKGQCIHPSCGCDLFFKIPEPTEKCPDNRWK